MCGCDGCECALDLYHKFGGVTSLSSSTTIDQADPLIQQHAVHWVLCIETYSSPDNRRPNIAGWTLMDGGTPDHCIYTLDEFMIIAFRGTTSPQDVFNDIALSIPGTHCDFEKAGKMGGIVRNFMQQGYFIEVTGHSLGGAIAKCLGDWFKVGVVTFNAAAPPSNPVYSIAPNQIHYHIVFDIISAWIPSVRIDKKVRPGMGLVGKYTSRIPVLKHLFPKYTIQNSVGPILKAHKLEMFSNEKKGISVDKDYEQSLWFDWYNNLPIVTKNVFLKFIQASSLPTIP